MIFEFELFIWYVVCVKLGEIFSCISIGIKIGFNSVYFVEFELINRFINVVKKIIFIIVIEFGSVIVLSSFVFLIVSNVLRFDLLNVVINNV